MRASLLKGRTILDCSALLPGPFIGKLLVDRGARVIKVENPARRDPARFLGIHGEGGVSSSGVSPKYQDLNEKKELVLLNLTVEADRVRFRELVTQADGLIEGFRPQAKKKLGLDEITLHSINPKICIVSLVGYPEDGEMRDRPGHDINFAALSGCLSLFGEMPALPLADLFSAYEGALELIAAMDFVTRGGKGSRVVVSMLETLKEVQSSLIREFKADRAEPLPGTTLFSGKFPCYRLYRSKDGRRVSVGAIEHKFWEKICDILGLPHLKSKAYATGADSVLTVAEIEKAFCSRTWTEWAKEFSTADCCVEPVLSYNDLFP